MANFAYIYLKVISKVVDFVVYHLFHRSDYIRIDGSVLSNIRQMLVKQFQENERCRVAILGIQVSPPPEHTFLEQKLSSNRLFVKTA